MQRFFFYFEDELCPNSQALRAGYPFAGGHDPNSELRIGQQARKIGQHPGTRTAMFGSSSALGLRSGQGSDLNPPTHPDTSDLSHIRQQSQEIVHHFWARFLLVMSKVKDCRKEDAIPFFCKNCMDKGILNAISHRYQCQN